MRVYLEVNFAEDVTPVEMAFGLQGATNKAFDYIRATPHDVLRVEDPADLKYSVPPVTSAWLRRMS